jgi:hypothetical protein
MPHRHAVRCTAAAVIFAALLAACGSYTKHDFITSADAICASTVRQTRSLAPPSSQQLSALSAYLDQLLPILRSELKQIRALQHPAGSARDGATLASYLRALAQSVSAFETLAAAAKAGDRQSVASAEAALRVSPVGSLATRYGLRSCGTPGATVA